MTKVSDFRRHIELHRERVVLLGLALAREKFPRLNSRQLEGFLRLHDSSKTMVTSNIQKYGYSSEKTPLERLFTFFGVSQSDHERNLELQEAVSEINQVDYRIGLEYFDSLQGIDSEAMRVFYIIEKVADLVDRSLDPMAAHEFGREMIPASQYLQDSELVSLALWLEQHYHRLTGHLTFVEVV